MLKLTNNYNIPEVYKQFCDLIVKQAYNPQQISAKWLL